MDYQITLHLSKELNLFMIFGLALLKDQELRYTYQLLTTLRPIGKPKI